MGAGACLFRGVEDEKSHFGSRHMTPHQVYPVLEDTLLLLGAALAECRPGERVLEIGCGSGCISEELSRNAFVLATDISPHAVRAAREYGIDVVRADLLSGIRGPFDLVIFNPPYLPTFPEDRIDDWLEHALDGGPDGRAVLSGFIRSVGRVLAPGGRVLLLISSLTGLREVEFLLDEAAFEHEIVLRQRIEGEDLLVIRGKPGPKQQN
jgi:release factor glutamine methyltransferase